MTIFIALVYLSHYLLSLQEKLKVSNQNLPFCKTSFEETENLEAIKSSITNYLINDVLAEANKA